MGSEKLVLMAVNVTETCGLPFMDIWVVVITHTHAYACSHNTKRHWAISSQSVLCGSLGICDHFLADPWINFLNCHLAVYLFFIIKRIMFCEKNQGMSLISDMFISYDL